MNMRPTGLKDGPAHFTKERVVLLVRLLLINRKRRQRSICQSRDEYCVRHRELRNVSIATIVTTQSNMAPKHGEVKDEPKSISVYGLLTSVSFQQAKVAAEVIWTSSPYLKKNIQTQKPLK